MAEEDIKSDINEAKEGSEVAEPENETANESKVNEPETEVKKDEPEVSEPKSEPKKDSKVSEPVNEDEDKDESKENISSPKSTPVKTVPLYDQPLTQSGKRVRAKVEQFKVEQKEEPTYEFNGSGTALGDIPFVEEMINKEIADNLKKIHSLCFGRPGDRLNVKKHLRQFNGYSFDKSDKRFAAKKVSLDRLKNAELKNICQILGLERSGVRPDIMDRILDFIVKPEDHGKKPPSDKKKKRKSKSGSKKTKKRGPRKSTGSGVDTENDDSTANDTADDSGSESDASDKSDSEEDEKPKKTPAKKSGKTPAKKVAKKTPAKKTPAKKTPAKKSPVKRSKAEVDSDSDSSDDEPLIKKTKAPPSNDEIKKKVEKILEGADLEEVTMKTVCKQIYDMYPDFDLTDRKSFIKDTVKSIIS